MILKVIGYLWMGLVYGAFILFGLAASYFLFIGGLMDLFTDRTLTSGIEWVDERNREFIAERGQTVAGLLKLVVGEGIVIVVCSLGAVILGGLPGGALVAAGGAWQDRRARDESV